MAARRKRRSRTDMRRWQARHHDVSIQQHQHGFLLAIRGGEPENYGSLRDAKGTASAWFRSQGNAEPIEWIEA